MKLTDEQTLLKDSVEKFTRDRYGFEQRHQYMNKAEGFSRENWAAFAELGWLALPFGEDAGGLGGSVMDVAVLGEALGKGLILEPFVETVLLGGGLLERAGDAASLALLEEVMTGGHLLTLAFAEPRSRYNLAWIETTAEVSGGDYTVNGLKNWVPFAAAADSFIVTARLEGDAGDADGILLLRLAKETPGLEIDSFTGSDGRPLGRLRLVNARVPAANVLASGQQALAILQEVIDRATVYICAEAVGIMDALISQTVEYASTRVQYGRPLASLQVIRHGVAEMYTAAEMARSAALLAASGDSVDVGAVSQAKITIGQSGIFVGEKAVQFHGGMGVSDELIVSHYYKRLLTIERLFGDQAHHVQRLSANF